MEKSYSYSVHFKKGNRVIIDYSITDFTPGWENWVWCILDDNTGWVPVQILKVGKAITNDKKEAIIIEDYSINELNVDNNEVVIGEKILNGWIWCRKVNEEIKGWVPTANVKSLN